MARLAEADWSYHVWDRPQPPRLDSERREKSSAPITRWRDTVAASLTHPNEAGNYYQDARTDSCRPLWLVMLHSPSRHVTFRSLTPTHVTSVTSPHTTWLRPGIYCLLLHRPKWTSAQHQTRHQTHQTHRAPAPGHLAGARGAGLQRPIPGRGEPARPGPDLAPGATRSPAWQRSVATIDIN